MEGCLVPTARRHEQQRWSCDVHRNHIATTGSNPSKSASHEPRSQMFVYLDATVPFSDSCAPSKLFWLPPFYSGQHSSSELSLTTALHGRVITS